MSFSIVFDFMLLLLLLLFVSKDPLKSLTIQPLKKSRKNKDTDMKYELIGVTYGLTACRCSDFWKRKTIMALCGDCHAIWNMIEG